MVRKSIRKFQVKGASTIDRISAAVTYPLSNNEIAGWGIGFLLVACSLWIRSTMFVGTDPAFYYLTAEKILHGKRYYYDFFESNFPLNYYIYILPVLLSYVTGMTPAVALPVFTSTVALLSIYASSLILKRASVYQDKALYNTLIVGLFLGHFLPFMTFPNNEIGTKTLLVLAFVVPYMCYGILEVENKTLPAAGIFLVGVSAGLLPALKPHYAIFLVFMESYILWRKKSLWFVFRPINYVIVTVSLLHALWLVVWLPEYLFKIIPMVMVSYDGIHQDSFLRFVELVFRLQLLPGLLFLIGFLVLPQSESNRVLLVMMLAATMIFGLEGLGSWDQVSVVGFFIFTLVMLLMVGFIRHADALKTAIKVPVFLLCTIMALLLGNNFLPTQKLLEMQNDMIAATREWAPFEPVLILSDKMYMAMLIYTHNPYLYKIPALSFLRGLQNSEVRYAHTDDISKKLLVAETQKYFIDAHNEALQAKPKMVFVSNINTRPLVDRCLRPHLELFLQNAAFREEWQNYVWIRDIPSAASDHHVSMYIRVPHHYYWGSSYIPRAIPTLKGFIL